MSDQKSQSGDQPSDDRTPHPQYEVPEADEQAASREPVREREHEERDDHKAMRAAHHQE